MRAEDRPRYHSANGAPERIEIIGFAGAFHGRTYAAVNAAGNPAYLAGFGPRLRGYAQLNLADAQGLREALARPTTAAVIVEPVQGEGGTRALDGVWLRQLRALCDAHGVLLIYDEVQTGMGRTGRLFAHQWFADCAPDIMAVAKALGGGFPVGACLSTRAAARGMVAGAHGSTFGGNPLAMAVAQAAFEIINTPDLLEHVTTVGGAISEGLAALGAHYDDIMVEVRGKGLLIGVKLIPNNRDFMAIAREDRLLIAGGGDNCVRLLPALNITTSEAREVLNRFEAACARQRRRLQTAA